MVEIKSEKTSSTQTSDSEIKLPGHATSGHDTSSGEVVQNFVDANSECTRVQEFLGQFQPGSKEPGQDDAQRLLGNLQKVYPCHPKQIECALPTRIEQHKDGIKIPEAVASLYFVEESRRIYCFVYDDYRNAVQYVIVTRDHSKEDLDQFSVIISGTQEENSALGSGPQSEAIYETLGNMHQGSARGFFGVPFQ